MISDKFLVYIKCIYVYPINSINYIQVPVKAQPIS